MAEVALVRAQALLGFEGDHRPRVEHGVHLRLVVAVGSGDDGAYRQLVPLRLEVPLRVRFASVGRIGAGGLDALRAAIAAGSDASDANEETWAEQAALLAKDDQEGHDAYVEKLKSGDEPTEADAPAANEAEASAEPAAEDASTQPDDAPEASTNDETIHPDTPQGGTRGTGEPPPEGGKGVSGGSQHRG